MLGFTESVQPNLPGFHLSKSAGALACAGWQEQTNQSKRKNVSVFQTAIDRRLLKARNVVL
jgi:hypothetical protein